MSGVGLWPHGLVVGLLLATTTLFTGLSLVNVRYGTRQIRARSDWLAETLDVEDPEEVIDYERTTTGLSLLESWTLLGALLVALLTGALGTLAEILAGTGLPMALQAIGFIGVIMVGYRLLDAPFDLFSTFVVDELFGFNETTPGLWLRDFLLQTAIAAVLVGAIFGILSALVARLPTAYWATGGWALVTGVGLLMQVIYPRVIAPLFNDFEPIEDGDLRAGIEDLFDRVGFETEGIYRMDASRRSSRLNAYFVGFGRAKRVVLFDTLLDRLDREAVLSVLAHELAHWTRGHIWKRLGASALQTGVAFAVLGVLVGGSTIASPFGFPAGSVYGELFVAALVVYPLLEVSAPLVNRVSLAHEREADRFAVEAMDDAAPMVRALGTLARENLANPFPHPWYAAFTHTHPPIPERIREIERYDATAAET